MPMRSDEAACAALLRQGSRSFHAASFLLPARIRQHATALYAFCRVADDAIDLAADDAARRVALADLRGRLEEIYRGQPRDDAVDRAFGATRIACDIPMSLPAALLEGFAWDAEARRYGDFAALLDYAARVAGSVGVMMALAMGVRDAPALARACELGMAMQLSNIARDVGEDAAHGRLYLPLDWLEDAGVDAAEFLAAPHFDARIGAVVQRLLGEADRLYARAQSGIAALPSVCRPGIRAAMLLYGEIGREVGRRGGDSVSARAVVSGRRKAVLLARSFAVMGPAGMIDGGALAEAAFLVDAAARPVRPAALRANAVVWVLELFERLEQRDRLRLDEMA